MTCQAQASAHNHITVSFPTPSLHGLLIAAADCRRLRREMFSRAGLEQNWVAVGHAGGLLALLGLGARSAWLQGNIQGQGDCQHPPATLWSPALQGSLGDEHPGWLRGAGVLPGIPRQGPAMLQLGLCWDRSPLPAPSRL